MLGALSLSVLVLLTLTACGQPGRAAFLRWYTEHIAGEEREPSPPKASSHLRRTGKHDKRATEKRDKIILEILPKRPRPMLLK